MSYDEVRRVTAEYVSREIDVARNEKNPQEWFGEIHNDITDHLREHLAVVVRRTSCGINETKTEEAILALAESFALKAGRGMGPTSSLPDIRPPRMSFFQAARDPLAVVRQLCAEGRIGETVSQIMTTYLETLARLQLQPRTIIEMTRKLEATIDGALQEGEDLQRLYRVFAVGRHSAAYWGAQQATLLRGWPFPCPWRSPVPNEPLNAARIDWWKVLAVDCIGGLMSGPVGYVGASAISVVSQS